MTPMTKTTITLTKERDCKGSVRFDAPKTKPGDKPNAVDNIYISRSVPEINTAQTVTITIETP